MDKRRILIVDDEPGLTQLVKMALEQTGAYEVRGENQAARALATAGAFKPDLIFLDVVMPEMDGGEVATQLKADVALKDVPIVFLTAMVSREEAADRKGIIGGHPFLAKPVGVRDVIACIEKQLGPAPQASAVSGARTQEQRNGKKQILIIDDEPSFRELFKMRVEALGAYACLVAASGQEGLKLASERQPDLVLLDVTMPDMDGFQALKQLKALAPELPVAMVTAVWKEDEAKRCFDAGAYEYITKPVDFDYLKTALLVKLL